MINDCAYPKLTPYIEQWFAVDMGEAMVRPRSESEGGAAGIADVYERELMRNDSLQVCVCGAENARPFCW